MAIQKRRFKAVLIALCFYTLGFSQTWETTVIYQESTNSLEVNVTPAFAEKESYNIDFEGNILNQNKVEDLKVWNDLSDKDKAQSYGASFTLDNEAKLFSYKINLKSSTNIPTRAYLEYGEISLANWSEILFATEEDIAIDILFIKNGTRYPLGTKLLSEWQLNPTSIQPVKQFVDINNIKVFTNLANPSLNDLLKRTLENFTYYENEVNLYLLFGNEKLASGGAFYNNTAVVYLDAATTDPNSPFVIEQVVLHELFHGISPYKIYPESEAKLLDKNWLSEAAPEYFALKYLLANDLITPKQFLEKMESKLRKATAFSEMSLEEMSYGIYSKPEFYQAFYSKGTIAMFLLDLKIRTLKVQDITALGFFLGDYDLNEAEMLKVSDALFEVEQELVLSNEPFPLNAYFESYGLIYERQVVLPQNGVKEEATIRKENILLNKMASLEQKASWEGFIAK